MVEVAGEAADDGLVAGVGQAEPAGGEAAEVFVRADDDDGFAHLAGLDGGGDGRAGAAVDDQVVRRLMLADWWRKEQGTKSRRVNQARFMGGLRGGGGLRVVECRHWNGWECFSSRVRSRGGSRMKSSR